MSTAAAMVMVNAHEPGLSSNGVDNVTTRPGGAWVTIVGVCDDPTVMKVWLDSPGCTGLAEMTEAAAAGAAVKATNPMTAKSGPVQRSVLIGPN